MTALPLSELMRDNSYMVTTLDTARIDQLAIAFMVDRVGVDHDTMAALLDIDLEQLVDILENRGETPRSARSGVDAFVAIQSLLLSGYTPDGAVEWMNTASPNLDGASPRSVLMRDEGRSVATVLRAAYDRMSS